MKKWYIIFDKKDGFFITEDLDPSDILFYTCDTLSEAEYWLHDCISKED
jgi:hypothetical protein